MTPHAVAPGRSLQLCLYIEHRQSCNIRVPSSWGCALVRQLIDLAVAERAAPARVREEARACFEEIADGLAGIPQDHVFWDSVRGNQLCLLVRGWSFFYTVDGDTLRIVEVCREVRLK